MARTRKTKKTKKTKRKAQPPKPRTLKFRRHEQLDLISDVRPENEKQIARVALDYRAVRQERVFALESEKQQKAKLLQLIKDANLTPMAGGKIRFHADGLLITVTPRDELVHVKDEHEDADEETDSESSDEQ